MLLIYLYTYVVAACYAVGYYNRYAYLIVAKAMRIRQLKMRQGIGSRPYIDRIGLYERGMLAPRSAEGCYFLDYSGSYEPRIVFFTKVKLDTDKCLFVYFR